MSGERRRSSGRSRDDDAIARVENQCHVVFDHDDGDPVAVSHLADHPGQLAAFALSNPAAGSSSNTTPGLAMMVRECPASLMVPRERVRRRSTRSREGARSLDDRFGDGDSVRGGLQKVAHEVRNRGVFRHDQVSTGR